MIIVPSNMKDKWKKQKKTLLLCIRSWVIRWTCCTRRIGGVSNNNCFVIKELSDNFEQKKQKYCKEINLVEFHWQSHHQKIIAVVSRLLPDLGLSLGWEKSCTSTILESQMFYWNECLLQLFFRLLANQKVLCPRFDGSFLCWKWRMDWQCLSHKCKDDHLAWKFVRTWKGLFWFRIWLCLRQPCLFLCFYLFPCCVQCCLVFFFWVCGCCVFAPIYTTIFLFDFGNNFMFSCKFWKCWGKLAFFCILEMMFQFCAWRTTREKNSCCRRLADRKKKHR